MVGAWWVLLESTIEASAVAMVPSEVGRVGGPEQPQASEVSTSRSQGTRKPSRPHHGQNSQS